MREPQFPSVPAPSNRFGPAHPRLRRQPLPWHRPKPAEEDPDAPRRVQAILDSPSYRQADRDPAFLAAHEARGVRLQIDYLKPELLLEQHRVQHTIVVFGSTRIPEPAAARRRVEERRREVEGNPNDDHLRRQLAAAERFADVPAAGLDVLELLLKERRGNVLGRLPVSAAGSHVLEPNLVEVARRLSARQIKAGLLGGSLPR